ncbi:MAG: hypothetical protein KJO98_06935, partial [Rhodothermia bacterium]|nr:hypothetical protein [Rhodothermia bacterium]
VLGECLMALGRYAEAEQLLIAGFETIRKANGPMDAALKRLISFYETVEREERATTYREMLDESAA